MIPIAEPIVTEEGIEAVVQVLKSGSLREGEKCRQFEDAFAKMVGAKHATTVSNGTAALHLAYANLIKPGDEVLVPTFTFFATASMVCWAGGMPIFCDIDPKTFCIDLNDAEKRLSSKTKAIAPVHLFGNACDIEGVLALAERHGLRIIWDAAQAHLTKYNGRDVGSYGDAVCYSFYATKNMTTGEGGMITSDNKDFIDRCVLFKRQGQEKKYYHTMLGANYRMTDMQAALGLDQLGRIGQYTEKRRRNAATLDKGLKDVEGIVIPHVPQGVTHSYHQYTILLPENGPPNREGIIKKLKARGIGFGINYSIPLHLQPVFRKYMKQADLPISEKVANRCLSLPVHPQVNEDDILRVVAAFKESIRAF